jgi:cytochrome oxidase assembly protein ShyY1
VLAHRGWLPALDAGVVDPADHIDAGPVRLRGLLLSFPDLGLSGSIASSKAVGAAGVEPGGSPPVGQFRRLWYRLDGAGIRRQLPYPTSALYLQVLPDSAPSPMAYPLALPLPELDAGPHLGYAVQWFIFAVVALGGWVVLLLRREGRGVDRRAGPGPGIGDPSVRASPEASR